MRKTQQGEDFQYWKKPWGPWLTLTAAVLQIISLWRNYSGWKDVFTNAPNLLTPSAWADYTNNTILRCAFNGLGATVFMGLFLIGICAKNERTARLLEAILSLFIAVSWGTAGLFLASDSNKSLWILIFIVFLVVAVGIIVLFLKSRNKQVST